MRRVSVAHALFSLHDLGHADDLQGALIRFALKG